MAIRSRALLVLLAWVPLAAAAAEPKNNKNCGCDCCKGEDVCCCELETTASAGDPERHPLRGVIVAINADDSTLTVKHEAIPGVMPAMTMLFKVEPAVLRTAKKGEAITAQMSRTGEDWWLHDVKPVAAKT